MFHSHTHSLPLPCPYYSLQVDKVMDAAGFSPSDGSALVKSFSGGWKMRVGIAKILLKEP